MFRKLQVMFLLLMGFASLQLSAEARAEEIRLGVMQAQGGEARKYQPLLNYLAKKGLTASFVTASTYPAAAQMFANGKVDAMFSGSGVAGIMIIKEVAEPLVRPVTKEGTSTYSGAVLVKKGGEKFIETNTYFAGKNVIVTSLASAGEIYLRSLGPVKAKKVMLAASHGAAIDAVDRGQADVAIVKNRLWDKEKSKYPGLEQVGQDRTENPDNTLIISRKLNKATAAKLAGVLLGLGDDSSEEATAAKASLNITRFIPTTSADFKGTLTMLRKTGVTKSFMFKY